MLNISNNIQGAEVCLACGDLNADLSFYTQKLGFRLNQIFPADDPTVAVISGYGIQLRLERSSSETKGRLRLICKDPKAISKDKKLKTPSGTLIEFVAEAPPLELPAPQFSLVVQKLQKNTPWHLGRAGMHYRDLIPERLGGSMIASHIRIPQGGAVPDMVHYHTIGFQLIFCYKGWVKVVYEDQGPPFYLNAGDCLIQPPEIRHRVLEASQNLEVIEIGVPAKHMTTIDHQLELPTPTFQPQRNFNGQTFCRHEAKKALWQPWKLAGFEFQETGISEATSGIASVQIVRFLGGTLQQTSHHTSDFLFLFVIQGNMTLQEESHNAYDLQEGDACAIPPHFKMLFSECSEDLKILEVALPWQFKTMIDPVEKLL